MKDEYDFSKGVRGKFYRGESAGKGSAVYGIFDTEDNIWIGNDDGPSLYSDPDIAALCAVVADATLGQAKGRCRAKEYTVEATKLRDEKPTIMTPLEAIKKLESGEI